MELSEIMMKPLGERVAGLVTAAAAAKETISALQESLEVSEAGRAAAEVALSLLTQPDEMPVLYHAGTAPPPEGVLVLVSVGDGALWLRDDARDGSSWQRVQLDMSGSSFYDWLSVCDSAGVLIGLRDDFSLSRMVADIQRHGRAYGALRRQVSFEPEAKRDLWTLADVPGTLSVLYGRLKTEAAAYKDLSEKKAHEMTRILEPSGATLGTAAFVHAGAIEKGASPQEALLAALAFIGRAAQ